MEYVNIPGTRERTSRLVFGCEQLGGQDWGRIDMTEMLRAVDAAVDHGINMFDTADVYGLGESERRLGSALRRHRAKTLIMTKGGVRWSTCENRARARTRLDISASYLRAAVHDSLRRIQRDCIDTYLLHWPGDDHQIRDAVGELSRLQDEGKLRYIGLSNCSDRQIGVATQVNAIAAAASEHCLVGPRVPANVLRRGREGRLGVLAYAALGRGLLAGTYSRDSEFPKDDRRHRLATARPKWFGEALRVAGLVTPIAARMGRTTAQVVLRWALDTPGVSCVICGMRSSSQLMEDLGATGWNLERTEWEELEGLAGGTWRTAPARRVFRTGQPGAVENA